MIALGINLADDDDHDTDDDDDHDTVDDDHDPGDDDVVTHS